MSIVYGNNQFIYNFTDPFPLNGWIAPFGSGIYAILKPNPSNTPQPFDVIYFGETGNFSERGFPWNHEKSGSWIANAGAQYNLYISIYYMPYSTPQQRKQVESFLINAYKPKCNDQIPAVPYFF